MSDLIGHSLGRYHVIERLGEGGMAIVYKARDTRLEREVAIKIIRTERLTLENMPKALKRFEREARALAKLTHPNIVPISDYGEHEGKPYLVMPYFSGGTLKSKLDNKPMPWRDAARILIPIADALGYAHKHDIIHRDVKPANILIAENEQPMLADFGVAKILEVEETMELTGTGVGIGMPEYMAPEQGSSKSIDHRADIYALGVVFYEMVAGRKPYVADTPLAVLIKRASEPLPRPKQFAPDLPQAVENVIVKSLAKKPEDRYQSMAEFAKAMEQILLAYKKQADKATQRKDQAKNYVNSFKSLASSFAKKLASIKSIRLSPRQTRFAGIFALALVSILGIVWFARQNPTFDISSFIPSPQAEVDSTSTASMTSTSTHAPSSTSTLFAAQIPSATDTPLVTAMPKLGIGSTTTGIDGMTLLYVPAGEFTMGSSDVGHDNEKPAHAVYLDAFWIDQTEVTQDMYKICVQSGKCADHNEALNTRYADPLYPVTFVSWDNAATYCEWAGRRLPTEAEWEKAARGTDGRTYPWGNEAPNANLMNYNDPTHGNMAKVGSYPNGASPYGAYDMAGNVWEWVNDWYSETYYQSSPSSNPLGPDSGESRVIRGGSWNDVDSHARSAYRTWGWGWPNPTDTSRDRGFRCAQSSDKTNTTEQTPAPVTTTPTVKATTSLGIGSTFVSDGLTMLYVPAGEFSMGSNDGDANAKPVHTVYLDGYYMDKYEVTNTAYKRCVDAGKCIPPQKKSSFRRSAYYGNPEFDEYPVIYVNWNMAKTYCEWRGPSTGSGRTRLPTEAEWEKAARGTDGRTYPWGENLDCNKANYAGRNEKEFCIGDTTKVGSYPNGVSPYGLYDMAGNVFEWVYDWYDEAYYQSSPSSNPLGPDSGTSRVQRGGGWYDWDSFVPSSARAEDYPDNISSGDQDGFRCAVSAADANAMISTPSSTVSPTPTK